MGRLPKRNGVTWCSQGKVERRRTQRSCPDSVAQLLPIRTLLDEVSNKPERVGVLRRRWVEPKHLELRGIVQSPVIHIAVNTRSGVDEMVGSSDTPPHLQPSRARQDERRRRRAA